MYNKFEIADTVFLKVTEIDPEDIKNFIAVNKYLPSDANKNWGHKYYPEIHRYAILKNTPNKIYIIFSPRIGIIKKVYSTDININDTQYSTDIKVYQKYDVLWEEREERNRQKGLGRHNQLETFYEENLIQMKSIEKFVSEREFEQIVCTWYF